MQLHKHVVNSSDSDTTFPGQLTALVDSVDMPVETCRRNKTTHPGLVLIRPQRRKEEVEGVKDAREKPRQSKKKVQLQHIQQVSDLEISEAEHYKSAANTTPIPTHTKFAHATKEW